MSDVIKVDIWSDVACPWCYIGKRKFEAGVAAFGGEVEVEYHSFELAPDTPVDFDGSEIDFLVKHKGMSAAQVKPMLDRVAGIAAEVGLDYDFDALQHTKTVKAHQLLHYAKQHGKQVETTERLLRGVLRRGPPRRPRRGPRRPGRRGRARPRGRAPLAARATSSSTTSAPTRTRRSATASRACRSTSSTASTACPAPSRRRRSPACWRRSRMSAPGSHRERAVGTDRRLGRGRVRRRLLRAAARTAGRERGGRRRGPDPEE